MSLFSRLFQAVRSWRPRRPFQPNRRAGVAVEPLDHRQLLSVNFTGNVPVDFPATQSPGVVVVPADLNNPSTLEPVIPPALQNLISVSGFYIKDIRVSYNSSSDTLSLGIDQPASGNSGQGQVIAGDSDNNGNSGTVNPAVLAVNPFFTDPANMGGSKYMGVFLGFNSPTTPQIVAGFSSTPPTPTTNDPSPTKPYEVAVANPSNLPFFGAPLPQYTGNFFLQNSTSSPNLEFNITHFSQLYQAETGHALTSSSVIYVGGQGGSEAADGISDAFIPAASVNIGAATQPGTPTPTPCPPQSPTIYVNYHEHRIVDSLHRDLVRVNVLGTSGFNVDQIVPNSVTLDGAHAIAHITRKTRRDPFPSATYVFVANQLPLHKGLNNVDLQGTLSNGEAFQSSNTVLNLPYASSVAKGRLHRYMGGGTIYNALAKIEKKHPGVVIQPTAAVAVTRSANAHPGPNAKLAVSYAPVVHATSRKEAARPAAARSTPRPVVTIQKADHHARSAVVTKVPTLLRHSMNDFLHHVSGRSAADATGAPSAHHTRHAG